MKITACLITREKEWPKETISLDTWDLFDEILIKTECATVWDRFGLAYTAKNDHIYMQDDDCIAPAQQLIREYDGVHITNAMGRQHYDEYRSTGETLIGWGSFFPLWRVESAFDRWFSAYGNLYLHQAPERVFTLLNQPHKTFVLPISHFDRPQKMWTQQGHFERRAHIRELVKPLL